MPVAERRSAKSLIDVAFDRLGDAVGAALVRMVIVLAPASQFAVMLGIASATSVAAIAVASRLHRWYLRTLETSLVEPRRGSAPGDDASIHRPPSAQHSSPDGVSRRQRAMALTLAGRRRGGRHGAAAVGQP